MYKLISYAYSTAPASYISPVLGRDYELSCSVRFKKYLISRDGDNISDYHTAHSLNAM